MAIRTLGTGEPVQNQRTGVMQANLYACLYGRNRIQISKWNFERRRAGDRLTIVSSPVGFVFSIFRQSGPSSVLRRFLQIASTESTEPEWNRLHKQSG